MEFREESDVVGTQQFNVYGESDKVYTSKNYSLTPIRQNNLILQHILTI